MTAADRWRGDLLAWAIPEEILAQAPESPWFFPAGEYDPDVRPLSISHRRAREALCDGGDVLDVVSGTGAMSRPLRPPARRIVAVDESAAALDRWDPDVRVVGRWPGAAMSAPRCDVVVCGHVVFNVADLADFVRALDGAAIHRVVVEMSGAHPLGAPVYRQLWRHFWSLERPAGPTWEDAVAVIRETGIKPNADLWQRPRTLTAATIDTLVPVMRRRLCLPAARDAEVRAVLDGLAGEHDEGRSLEWRPARMVTLWWDVGG